MKPYLQAVVWRQIFRRDGAGVLTLLALTALPLAAQREPVLKQIDLPHPYYYREMYLPQLTTGPSSAAWSSDSHSLVYSMSGTLWRQAVDSDTAEQLTAGPGYDYQPDCSPDGRWVAYVSYRQDALELWVLDLEKGQSHQLTSGGLEKFREFREQEAKLTASAEDATRLARLRYNGGSTSYLEVLTNDTNYYSAQLNLAVAKEDEAVSIVQLYSALGGGWQE